MIKKVLLAIALICPMLLSAQTLKIGLVDFGSILQAMPETTAAQNPLKEVSDKYEAEYKKLGEEMNRLVEEYQKMAENELPAIRERKTRELSDYQVKIQHAVESVGREGNYSLIQRYDPQLTLYYASPVEDITSVVKAKLGVK